MVLREGLKMAAIGGAIGLALSLPLPKLFGAIFFGMNASEPWVYAVVLFAILLVSMFATYVPARRAAQTEPMSALRQE